MSVIIKDLLQHQSVIEAGGTASLELLEVLQRQADAIREIQGKLEAIAAVASPSGGSTVDAEARAAIGAILAAV